MEIRHIGTGEPMIHAMVGMKTESVIIVNDCTSLIIEEHFPKDLNTLMIERIPRATSFIDYNDNQYRGKNKSKRKYPKPR